MSQRTQAATKTRPGTHVLTRMPVAMRWRGYGRKGDIVTETDFIWTLWGCWAFQPESADPAWDTRSIGPFVLAYRLTF